MPTHYLYMFQCMYPLKNKYRNTYFVKCTAKAFTKNRSSDPEQVVSNEGHVSMFYLIKMYHFGLEGAACILNTTYMYT